jgi:glycosyltransferase involved in cell wall biosynthesis
MHVLQVYNRQRSAFGGEEAVINAVENALVSRGHTASRFSRSSEGIDRSITGRIGAAFSGVYSFRAKRELAQCIREEKPDVVHVHNVYPLLSPSVFDACRTAGVPSVMTVHSHILTCPNWYHVRNGQGCRLCLGGHEYQCFLVNCRGNRFESAAYALRSYLAAHLGLFKRATLLIAVSNYLRDHLVEAGYARERIAVVPNTVPVPDEPVDPAGGTYVVFAGRLSHEKGVAVLIDAARATKIPVKIAGDGPLRHELEASAPSNVLFLGRLDRPVLAELYRGARMAIVPSLVCETFGLAAAEPMAHGLPVIGTGCGALSELAPDGVCGNVVPAGDATALAEAMTRLWNNPDALRHMGRVSRARVLEQYAMPRFADNLIKAYRQAMSLMEKRS